MELTKRLTKILDKVRAIETKVAEIEQIIGSISSADFELADLIPTLSTRELEILTLMTEGKKFSDIPALLGTSKRTVQAHRWNIQKKLKLDSSKDISRIVIPYMKKKS